MLSLRDCEICIWKNRDQNDITGGIIDDKGESLIQSVGFHDFVKFACTMTAVFRMRRKLIRSDRKCLPSLNPLQCTVRQSLVERFFIEIVIRDMFSTCLGKRTLGLWGQFYCKRQWYDVTWSIMHSCGFAMFRARLLTTRFREFRFLRTDS